MPTDPQGAIGSLDYSQEERRAFARQSQSWSCPGCGSSNATCFSEVEQIQSASEDATTIVEPSSSGPDTQAQEPSNDSGAVVEDLGNANFVSSVESTEPRVDTSKEDIIWVSVIIALVVAILGILIRKASAL